MKSWFIGTMADLGYLLSLLIFWGGALLFIYAARQLFKKSYRILGAVFSLAALFLFMLPHWGVFPGRQLAEITCRDIEGVHTQGQVPVKADSIYFEHEANPPVYGLAKLLLQDGFRFVEYSSPRPRHLPKNAEWYSEITAYSIEPAASSQCALSWKGGDSVADDLVYYYQRGMRYDECLVIKKQASSMADVKYSSDKKYQWFPVMLSIKEQRYTNVKDGQPISFQKTFGYSATNGYRSFGKVKGVDCHQADYWKFKESSKFVQGAQVPRNWPGKPVIPTVVSELSIVQPLRLELEESYESELDNLVYLEYYRDGMDLRAGGMQVWRRPVEATLDGKTIISWGEGRNAMAVEVPGFHEKARHIWEKFPDRVYKTVEKNVQVIGAKRLDDRIFLVRDYDGMWEFSEYEIHSGKWRRNYVDFVNGENKQKVVWRYNSLDPMITGLEIHPGHVTVKAFALRHPGAPTLVDSAFSMDVPRP